MAPATKTSSTIFCGLHYVKPMSIGEPSVTSLVPPWNHSVPHWGNSSKNNGKIKLVTSVELSAGDLEAIKNGEPKEDICEQRLVTIIEKEFADGVGDGTARLTRLLKIGRLEIRIAVPKCRTGIYHEKNGLFFDDDDFVAFTGSLNESRNAFENNRECIEVYASWSDKKRADGKHAHFEAIWNSTDAGVIVYSFPQAAQKKLLRVVGEWEARRQANGTDEDENLWSHQQDAISAFMDKRCGILEMATGTGKTRTALSILARLIRSNEIHTAIIAADGNDLLDQWCDDLAAIVAESQPRFRLLRHHGLHHDREEYLTQPENTVLLCSRIALQGVLQRLSDTAKGDAILIQDEVHRFGSASHVEKLDGLSDTIPWRLGLSATPEREYDQVGNDFITRNIGPVIFRYGLDEAIVAGILCEFDYVPLEWDPSEEDRLAVKKIGKPTCCKKGR